MASFNSKLMLFLMAIGLLATPLMGCGDAKVNTNVDEARNTDDATVPRLDDKYFLVAAGETRLIGNVTESVGLKVFLYDKVTGAPAANQIIGYEILEPAEGEPADLANLSAYNGTTNAEGAATIRSEERRVGKERRTRWAPEEEKR